MNYYEHHIGDFLKKTAHLTVIEEGVYRRLLDRYYIVEGPLPGNVRECCKLARASTKAERDAVAAVLQDFFTLTEDGYRQRRADEEIARFKDKQRKAKASADARWSQRQSQSERNANACANASPNAMRTHSEGNAPRARPQSPDTNTSEAKLPRERRGSRLPPDWSPGETGFAFAASQGLPNGKAQAELDKFRDYWTAKTGSDAVKADWQATWRNWVRRATESGPRAEGAAPWAPGHEPWAGAA